MNQIEDAYRELGKLLGQQPITSLYANVECGFDEISVDNNLFPISITKERVADNKSYVASLMNTYGAYALEELESAPLTFGKPILRVLIYLINRVLAAAKVDDLISFNNWLLSTNLYPDWSGQSINEMTKSLVKKYPTSFAIARSLNEIHHSHLIEKFKSSGWIMMPARRIWTMSPQKIENRVSRDLKRDRKLLLNAPFQRDSGVNFTDTDFQRAEELYAALYLAKYSKLNPELTALFMKTGVETGLLYMEGLRDQNQQLIAVVGTIERNGVMTSPVVGYDTSYPIKTGLYRMTMVMGVEYMMAKKLTYNLSAGVGKFKRLRGAEPNIEWTACYCGHLSFFRRGVINVLATILRKVGVPLMEKYDL